jgi:drug/metabolite transporter (DMT)-like permease
VLAFAGIALAFLGGGKPSKAAGAAMLLGDLLALAAGMAWGATTVAIRTTRLASLPAAQTLLYQLTTGFVLLLPAAFLLGQTRFEPTPLAWAGLAFQAVLVCFVSFLVWFWLLSEPIEPNFLAGALMVLAGVLLVSGYGWLKSLRR